MQIINRWAPGKNILIIRFIAVLAASWFQAFSSLSRVQPLHGVCQYAEGFIRIGRSVQGYASGNDPLVITLLGI